MIQQAFPHRHHCKDLPGSKLWGSKKGILNSSAGSFINTLTILCRSKLGSTSSLLASDCLLAFQASLTVPPASSASMSTGQQPHCAKVQLPSISIASREFCEVGCWQHPRSPFWHEHVFLSRPPSSCTERQSTKSDAQGCGTTQHLSRASL